MSKRDRKSPRSGDSTDGNDSGAAIADGGNADIGGGNGIGAITIEPAGPATVEPETVATEPGQSEPADQPRRRRGRPPGSGNSTGTGERKAKPLPLNVSGLEKLLLGIHGGMAMLTRRAEWSLDSDQKLFDGKAESEFMAQSIADVARHYGGIADQKTLDWLNLLQCLAMVYGTRVYAIAMTPKAKPVRQAQPHEFRATQQPQFHMNGAVEPQPRATDFSKMPNAFDQSEPAPEGSGIATIAGIGEIELPDGHPLKPKLN